VRLLSRSLLLSALVLPQQPLPLRLLMLLLVLLAVLIVLTAQIVPPVPRLPLPLPLPMPMPMPKLLPAAGNARISPNAVPAAADSALAGRAWGGHDARTTAL
jgi:hypothetical protein